MRRTLTLLLLTATLVASAPIGARAADDPNGCRGTIGGQYVKETTSPPGQVQIPVVTDGVIIPINDAKKGPFYADIRDLASEYLIFSLWLYQESNLKDGLQRGGRSMVPDTEGTDGNETCQEARPPLKPDNAIF